MLNNTYSRSEGGFALVRTIIALIIAAIVGYSVWLGISIRNVGELFGQASIAYEQVQASAEAQDYQTALAYARTAASLASQASGELSGVQWEIASKIPVLGTDADTMRSIGAISGNLSNNAVLPVLDAWDVLAQDGVMVNGQPDMSKISEKLDQFVALANTLQSASSVVDQCSAQANDLPASHFGMLNDWVSQLKGSITSVDEVFDQIDGVVNLVVNLTSAFSSLVGGASTSAAA